MSLEASFLKDYTDEISRCLSNDYQDNHDERRFGPEALAEPAGGWLKQRIKAFLKSKGYIHVAEGASVLQWAYNLITPYLPRLELLYSRLADQESKTTLVKVLAFRALGYRKVKLTHNTPELWQDLERIESCKSQEPDSSASSGDWPLNLFDLSPLGVPVSLYFVSVGVHNTFIAQQYRCNSSPFPISVSSGDYVLDGGGCWGDTALYFSDKVGSEGKVFTFEFVPRNLDMMRKNLELNPSLKSRIEILDSALWRTSGESLSYHENGPGSRVDKDQQDSKASQVKTISIDDFVSQNEVAKLDFIKMDIEGAELPALQGAEKVLRCFKPKLAICVYHSLNDFFDIPEYLYSLGLNYRFYLRHFSIHAEETILFACAD